MAFILSDAFVTLIINGQQRQILLLLHQSFAVLILDRNLSASCACVILKKIRQFRPSLWFGFKKVQSLI